MAEEIIETQEQGPVFTGMAANLEGFVSQERLVEIQKMEDAKAAIIPQEKPVEEEKVVLTEEESSNENTPGAESTEADTSIEAAEEKPASEEEKPKEEKSVFGLKTKKEEKKPELVIENMDQAIQAINKQFGQSLKDAKDLPKFFESISKTRANAQKFEEAEKRAGEFEKILKGLPEELFESIQDFYNARDYTTRFTSKPKFDLNKTAENQDVKELVNHYFPGKFTDEDFEEETKSAALEIAESAAIDKFNVEKQTRDTKRVAEETTAKQKLESVKKSVSDSVNYLKQSFPDMENVEVQEASRTLDGGVNSILGLFFNQDGTFKPEAAEAVMMIKHGKAEIQRAMNIAAKDAETRINEELVSRGADRPNPTKTGGGKQDALSQEAQKLMGELKSFHKKTTY